LPANSFFNSAQQKCGVAGIGAYLRFGLAALAASMSSAVTLPATRKAPGIVKVILFVRRKNVRI